MIVMDAQGGGRDARFNLGYNMSLLSGETSPELYTGGTHRTGLNPALARQGLLSSSCSSGLPRGIKRSSSDVCFDQDVRSVQPLSINTDLSPDVTDDGYTQVQQNKKTPPPNGKKTKGRVKIKMEYIDNKLRRYTTFSKRKTGIMKKVSKLLDVAYNIIIETRIAQAAGAHARATCFLNTHPSYIYLYLL